MVVSQKVIIEISKMLLKGYIDEKNVGSLFEGKEVLEVEMSQIEIKE